MTLRDMLRPSKIGTGFSCPASIALCQGLAKRASGPEAEAGTRLHRTSEIVGRAGLRLSSAAQLALALADGATEVEFWDAVFPWLRACANFVVAVGEDGLASGGEDGLPRYAIATRTAREFEFECHFHEPKLNYGGTCDFVAHFDRTDEFPPRIVVADLKTGVGIPVEARGNMQLRSYAALLLAQLEREGTPAAEDTVIDLHIVQPRSARGRQYSSERVSVADLRGFWRELRASIAVVGAAKREDKANGNDEAMLRITKPGEHCRWCEAAGGCPAIVECLKLVQQADQPVAVSHAPPDVAAQLLDLLAGATAATKNLKDALVVRVRLGDVPGWTLKEVAGRKGYHAPISQEHLETLLALGEKYEGQDDAFVKPTPIALSVLRKKNRTAYEEADALGLVRTSAGYASLQRDVPSGTSNSVEQGGGKPPLGFDTNNNLKEPIQ